MMKSIDFSMNSYHQEMYHYMVVGMSCLVFAYSVLFVAMALILYRLMKDVTIMAWQDVILLSILNFVGSMIAGVVNGLLIVKIDTDAFVLL